LGVGGMPFVGLLFRSMCEKGIEILKTSFFFLSYSTSSSLYALKAVFCRSG
jgi:hypothetical protein